MVRAVRSTRAQRPAPAASSLPASAPPWQGSPLLTDICVMKALVQALQLRLPSGAGPDRE